MELLGRSFIGYSRGATGGATLQGIDATTGDKLEPIYHAASRDEVGRAAELAERAFEVFGRTRGRARAVFLRAIAACIERRAPFIVARCHAETALPVARLQAELARTTGQLRLFADLVEEGSWVMARIDRAVPDRKPLPKPDVRSLHRPLGPVAVFCASNFPLAFSVAGGDTASALAAGCPVVVMAHEAHPGTAELVGSAVVEAAMQCDLPEGVFSLLYAVGHTNGEALVQHAAIKAGGFTGSRRGGRWLFDLCVRRPEPIPFYAEMSSVNPVIVLPGALRARGEPIAQGLHGSIVLGAGQFCTCPGLVAVETGEPGDHFVARLAKLQQDAPPMTMLHDGIRAAYLQGIETLRQHDGVKTTAFAEPPAPRQVYAALFEVDVATFLDHPELAQEVFGPSSIMVRYRDREQLGAFIRSLDGQLTATIHGEPSDLRAFADLIAVLETKVGRLVFNGYPTGVEVCHAMVHGGPYPATSDGRSTSVGTQAIYRFTRPICFQNWPDDALPDELQNANPLGIWRLVDGVPTRDAL